MKFNSHLKLLIIPVLFLGIVSFIFIFIFNKININEAKSKEILTEWQSETSKYNEIKSLNNSVKIITNQKNMLENHFTQSSDPVPFLNLIEKLGLDSAAKTTVTSVDISPDKASLLVGIKTGGTFESVYKFLNLLENSPYELEFVSMDIQNLDVQNITSKKVKTLGWEGNFKIRLLSFVQ